MCAARSPSANVGVPSGTEPARDRRVDVGHERVEAVRVPCGWPAGSDAKRAAAGDSAAGSRRTMLRDSRRPHQSSSGCSWSKAIASSLPSSSIQSRFFRPAEIWLIDDRAERSAVGLELHERGVLGRDRARSPAVPARSERVPAGRAGALRHGGEQARREPGDPVAGDELGQVAPVRADVGERPGRAAQLVVHAPVRRRRAAGASPGGTCRGAGAAFRLVRRGRARAPRERSGSSGRRTGLPPGGPSRRRLDELLRAGCVGRQGLLADDVLAGSQRRLGEREMEVVGRADVDDVDGLVGDQLVGRGVGAVCGQLGRGRGRGVRRRGGDAGELGAGESQGTRMDSPDEPGPGDRRTQRHRRGRLNGT